jgi:O-antigen ligase
MTFYDQKFGTPVRAPKTQAVAPKAPVSASRRIATVVSAVVPEKKRTTLAYSALLTFSFLYFARPEDFVPGLALIPVAKISGFLALLGLLLSWTKLKTKMPLAIKLVLVLLVHMCLTVVFAFWRGGAFDIVVNQFSKAAIVAVLIAMIVNTVDQLRKLLWVQCAAIAVMTIASILVRPSGVGGGTRLWGLGGIFSNPNDLAISIAINFPLCLAMFLGSKGALKKLLWAVAMVFQLYGVLATYSRSGLIAMVVCFMICIWEFGLKGRRPQLIVAAIFIMLAGTAVAISNPKYIARVKTLVEGGDVEDSGDKGSLDARRELLMESIRVTFQHPIFGVGPGNFQAITKSWHVTHNTYTELSSETGLTGLGLFLAILYLTFRSLRKVPKTDAYKADPRIQLFTSALRAGLTAYIVGAAFASTSYTLFPYFMVAYVSALYKITTTPELTQDKLPVGPLNSRNPRDIYGKQEQHALAGTR